MNNREAERMVGVVLPESLITKIQEEGQRKERSMSAQIRYILKEWAEREEKAA
jgi:Arc/MetJ-type ribon-helix-helix transcriptional regulator